VILTSSRSRRALSLVIAAGAATTLLSACDKPQPTITVLSGSKSKIVKAQPECVILAQCTVDLKKVTDLNAARGGTILIDVPKSLASAGWIVTAYTQDSTGKNTPIEGAGSATVNDHSVRVRVPEPTTDAGGSYVLQVSPPAPSKRTQDDRLTTWIVRVQLSQ
jgi:hypothetical protein